MKMNVYTVYDLKACAYSRPWYSLSHSAAMREFGDAVNDPQAPFGKHPEDYQLVCVGSWDDVDGLLEPSAHVPLAKATDFVKDTPSLPLVNDEKE